MVTPTDVIPIRAQFGEDNEEWTTQGTASYLKRIYDPINADFGTFSGTGLGGMSSRGASRWGFGHTSSRGPVASNDSNYPHDNQGNGDFWSVQWNEAFQIVTHYYTGIQIVDNGTNFRLPSFRWNPLEVDWGGGSATPPQMNPGQSYNVEIELQNTGAFFDWTSDTKLTYRWEPSGGSGNVTAPSLQVGDATAPDNGVTLGIQAPSTPGVYRLIIDMSHPSSPGNSGYFASREPGRPWYPLSYEVCVGGSCGQTYLPLVMKSDAPPEPDVCQNYLVNGSFENGLDDWSFEAEVFFPSVGTVCTENDPPIIEGDFFYAQLGRCDNNVDTLMQSISIPAGANSVDIEYDWYSLTTEAVEPPDEIRDFMTLTIENSFGFNFLQRITSSSGSPSDWTKSAFDLSEYIGQTIGIRFRANNDNKIFDSNGNAIYDDPTKFLIDNVTVIVCGPSSIHP